MPNIKLQAPVSKDQVREIIGRRCPDLDIGSMGAGLTAYSSPWVAAMIGVNKKTLSFAPMVASMKMFLLFFLIAVTGIGLVIYAVSVIPKQQALVKRVHAVIAEEVAAQAAAAGASGTQAT